MLEQGWTAFFLNRLTLTCSAPHSSALSMFFYGIAPAGSYGSFNDWFYLLHKPRTMLWIFLIQAMCLKFLLCINLINDLVHQWVLCSSVGVEGLSSTCRKRDRKIKSAGYFLYPTTEFIIKRISQWIYSPFWKKKKKCHDIFGCIQLSDVSCNSLFYLFLFQIGKSQPRDRYLSGCKSRLRHVQLEGWARNMGSF